ncbi:SPX domain-containing protein 1-like [Arachis duranensis]|uniref:SPX domain-containing protein 1-like n=1 Tax=Arachis duranensis TaxID=130453 RepID=A0A6P4CT35_ARADU|nr:SPX domain-containing protein 1-like [Arachis duranensis]
MHFMKKLRKLVEQTQPEWRDKFLCYKELKKLLKIICPRDQLLFLDPRYVNHFLQLLLAEIDKFNAFFVEKEEEYIIKWKELQDRVDRAIDLDSDAELMALGRDMVDLHGEMVLLENYSLLNYTGLVKIIKKYDKRTGALHRLPFIQQVLNQPFFKIDVVNKLVKECEIILSILFPLYEGPSFSTNENYDRENNNNNNRNNETSGEIPKMQEVSEEVPDKIENMENEFIKLTLMALQTLREIRSSGSSSSTPSI